MLSLPCLHAIRKREVIFRTLLGKERAENQTAHAEQYSLQARICIKQNA